MGNKSNNKKKDIEIEDINLQKTNFEFLYVIGKGGFGKVWKINCKRYKKQFALKEMSKAKIIDKKSENSIKYERELLSKINHPYFFVILNIINYKY